MTLDDDVLEALREITRQRGTTFKEAVNLALRAGLAGAVPTSRPYRLPTRPMHARKDVDLDKSLQLAGTLEDVETVRELSLRK